MSIERERDGRKTVYIATCDNCGAELRPRYLFLDAVQEKKDAGWYSRTDENGNWKDYCTECKARNMK